MLRVFLALFLLIPLPVLADHVPTQEPYGYEENIVTPTDADPYLEIKILSSDGWEDSPPNKYTIFFAMATGVDASSYCVSTDFGHTDNNWNTYNFTLTSLRTYFELPVGTFYYRVRSDNDTDNSYSTISAERSIALPNETPWSDEQTDWSAPSVTCNDTSTTTTTTTTVPEVKEEVVQETTTTTTTTTTTLPPLPPPPPPPPPEPEKVEVVMEDGSKAEYEIYEVEDGTVDRDNQRKANEDKFGCYMTNAQIERGDCNIPKEEPKEEVIIVVDEERDTKEELPDDDVVVPELEPKDEVKEPEPIKEEDIVEEEIKIDVKELEEEFDFEEIIIEIPDEIIIIIKEDIVEEDIVVTIVEKELDEEVKEITKEVLVEPVQENVKKDIVKLTEEEVAIEVVEVEEVIKNIVIEEVTTEEVIEVIEQVNDIGVQNLNQATEEVQEVVQAVVEEAIKNVKDLSEEQVAVVAEVLQVQKNDVEIIAEAVKKDKVVAEAVEEYVERAVKNANVENYTLADVVTEIQYEAFLKNPIETFVDFNFEGITLSNIGDDMTNDQKEKAQEVVVPVILTRIATIAAFVFRRSL